MGEKTSSLLRLLLLFLDFDDFATFIKSTIRADGMGKAHGTAVRTGDQAAWLQSVVRAAHIAAALRVFALWMWGHSTYSLVTVVWAGAKHPTPTFLNQAGRL